VVPVLHVMLGMSIIVSMQTCPRFRWTFDVEIDPSGPPDPAYARDSIVRGLKTSILGTSCFCVPIDAAGFSLYIYYHIEKQELQFSTSLLLFFDENRQDLKLPNSDLILPVTKCHAPA
jgi:hypothetical protein